jgi:acetylornithine deacetylase
MDRIAHRLTELVTTPSPTGQEHDAVDLVASWLRSDGADEVDSWVDRMADLERDPAYPGREVERSEVPVVAARVCGNRPGPTVVLTGHVDTVAVGEPARWTRDPFGAEIEGDLLFGRGACDMKAGVVSAVEAFGAVASGSRDFAGELRFVCVPGEEVGGTGTLSAIRRGGDGDLVVITEPTTGDIVVSHGGALTFSIDLEGRAAHGSTPDAGISALDLLVTLHPVIDALERAANDLETDPRMRALGTPYATTIGIVRGGTWASNVMESLHAEARVGVRVGETVEEAAQRFTNGLLAGAEAADPWFADHPPRVALTGARFGSSSIDPDHRLVTAVADAAASVTGARPALIGAPYGCDMALWTRVGGAATLVYGPGDVTHAHAADERVSLTETAQVAEALVDAVNRLLG